MKTTNKKKHWSVYLEKMYACEPAVEFARRYKTPAAAWKSLLKKAQSSSLHQGWAEWIGEKLINGDDGFCCCWCASGERGLSRLEFINRLPVPNVSDLESAVDGYSPWELIK